MVVKNTTPKDDLLKRLHRIEGQVRGITKMVEEDRDCREILQQLAAARAAMQTASQMVARSYACQCLQETTTDQQNTIDDLLDVLSKAA